MQRSVDTLPLTPAEMALLRKHCVLAGSIHRMCELRSFLTKEIHEKRSVFKRTRYKIEPRLESAYGKILFSGRKLRTGFDRFPCHYKGTLDDLLFYDIRSTNIEQAMSAAFPSLTCFYYSSKYPLRELQDARLFDRTEWSLGDPENDIATLERFRDEFIRFMESVEAELGALQFRRDRRVLARERRRYVLVAGQ